MRQPGPPQNGSARRQVGLQRHVPFAIVKVFAATVTVHDVDTATGAFRVKEQGAGIDPVPGKFAPDKLAIVIVAIAKSKKS